MEAVGIVFVFGTSVQVACVALSTMIWFIRRRIRPGLWAPWPTGVGGLAGWISALFPASELLFRIGLSNLPTCVAQEACRDDVLFSAAWLFGALFLVGLQIWLYRRAVSSG